MALGEIKKQVMILHQAVMMLELQYRLEAIDFLSDCCNDLRFKTLTYQDIAADHVLNLTMDQKEYIPFTGFEPAFCNTEVFQNPPEAHGQYDYGVFDYPIKPETVDTSTPPVTESLSHWDQPHFDDWDSDLVQNESANPVNLVMPFKEEPNTKKRRRKQMFTSKSVQRKRVFNDDKETSTSNETEQAAAQTNIPKKVPIKKSILNPQSCRLCRGEFADDKQFLKHKEICKKKTKAYSCKYCNERFRFQAHYLQHLTGHTQNDCKHCDKKFSSKNKYRHHLKADHPEIKDENESIPCKFCPKTFSRLKRLYNHYQLRHSKGKFVCTVCGLFLASKEKHREHMTEHDKDKKWTCDICNAKFFWKYTLAKHVNIHNSRKYHCITCDVSLTSKLELAVHKKKKHEVSGPKLPEFECATCNKLFPKKWELQRHLSSHSDVKMFGCKHCRKIFGTASALAKHQARNTHLNKAWEDAPESKYEKIYQDDLICENCGKRYKTQSQLSNHLRIHKTMYMCDTCGATFSLKNNLRRHVKGHSSFVQAVCELCGDSFARVAGLREHTFIKHSDPALFPRHHCLKCPKNFKRKSELNRHMRIHETARPFACYCGRSYKQSAHLRTHQKTAHSRLMGTPQPLPSAASVPLLSIGHFDDMDYNLQEPVPTYGEAMGYEAVGFGEQPSVSPAVDLTMVSMSETVIKTEEDPGMPLVSLSDRIVQEYLLNLP